MKKHRGLERIADLHFTIKMFDDGSAQIHMTSENSDRDDIRYATEYMMWIISEETDLPFEETMQRLVENAAKYKGVRFKVLPGKNGKG